MSNEFFKQGVPVHDMMGTKTTDRGYPEIATLAGNVMRCAQRVANLANGDGDAEDVRDIRDAIRQCVDIAQTMNTKAQSLKPLISEQ